MVKNYKFPVWFVMVFFLYFSGFLTFVLLFPLKRRQLGGKEVGEGRENENHSFLHLFSYI